MKYNKVYNIYDRIQLLIQTNNITTINSISILWNSSNHYWRSMSYQYIYISKLIAMI